MRLTIRIAITIKFIMITNIFTLFSLIFHLFQKFIDLCYKLLYNLTYEIQFHDMKQIYF